jgi:hypothetical protein
MFPLFIDSPDVLMIALGVIVAIATDGVLPYFDSLAR